MKIFGYSKSDEDTLLEMQEVTIQASPSRLRELAKFLIDFADQIERGKINDQGHSHLSDELTTDWNEDFSDVILYHNAKIKD